MADMVNKFRTLLLNESRYPVDTPYSQLIPGEFSPRTHQAGLETVRRALVPKSLDRTAREFLATLLVKIAWSWDPTRKIILAFDPRLSFDPEAPQLSRIRPEVTVRGIDGEHADASVVGLPGNIPDGFHRKLIFVQDGTPNSIQEYVYSGHYVAGGAEAVTADNPFRIGNAFTLPDSGTYVSEDTSDSPRNDLAWRVAPDLDAGFLLVKNLNGNGFMAEVEIFNPPPFTIFDISSRIHPVSETVRSVAIGLGLDELTSGISSADPRIFTASAIAAFCLSADSA